MKKHIILFALAAATLCACSTDEVIETSPPPAPRAIEFTQAFVTPASRGALTKDVLQSSSNGKFAVWGWMNTKEANPTSVKIFNGVRVTYTGGTWTYTPAVNWIPDRNYKFFALASTYNDTQTLRFQTPSRLTSWGGTEFEYFASVHDFTNDLIYATAEATTGSTIEEQPDAVGFTFNHVLAQVLFTITDNSHADHSLAIQEVKYSGFSSGKFTLHHTQPATHDRPAVTWQTPTANYAEVLLEGYTENDDTQLFTTAQVNTNKPAKPIFVVPNSTGLSTPAYNGSLEIKAKMYQGANHGKQASDVELIEQTKTASIEYNFLPGHSYHVKVALGDLSSGFPITFTVIDVTPYVDDNERPNQSTDVPVTIN